MANITCSSRTRATVAASLFGRGNASAHLENGSIQVRIHWDLLRLRGCGPLCQCATSVMVRLLASVAEVHYGVKYLESNCYTRYTACKTVGHPVSLLAHRLSDAPGLRCA